VRDTCHHALQVLGARAAKPAPFKLGAAFAGGSHRSLTTHNELALAQNNARNTALLTTRDDPASNPDSTYFRPLQQLVSGAQPLVGSPLPAGPSAETQSAPSAAPTPNSTPTLSSPQPRADAAGAATPNVQAHAYSQTAPLVAAQPSRPPVPNTPALPPTPSQTPAPTTTPGVPRNSSYVDNGSGSGLAPGLLATSCDHATQPGASDRLSLDEAMSGLASWSDDENTGAVTDAATRETRAEGAHRGAPASQSSAPTNAQVGACMHLQITSRGRVSHEAWRGIRQDV
jgi:hypothetical protein